MEIKAIKIEPNKKPELVNIDNGLDALQKAVGGDIECVYPWEDAVCLVCNEMGKLECLPLNRALCDDDGELYDIVAGTFLIVGCADDNFSSVPENLVSKYMALFDRPELFVRGWDGKISVIKN